MVLFLGKHGHDHNLLDLFVMSLYLFSSLWCRKRLFNMINDVPTVFEVVTGAAKKQQKEKSLVSNHSSNKSKSNSKPVGKNLSKRIFILLQLILFIYPCLYYTVAGIKLCPFVCRGVLIISFHFISFGLYNALTEITFIW